MPEINRSTRASFDRSNETRPVPSPSSSSKKKEIEFLAQFLSIQREIEDRQTVATSFPFPLEYRNETPISRKNSRESKMIEKAFAFVEGKEDRRAKVNRYWRRIEITVIKKNNKKKKTRRRRRGCR